MAAPDNEAESQRTIDTLTATPCANATRQAEQRASRASVVFASHRARQEVQRRRVGAVGVRDVGRQRLYRLNGPALKPIYDWLRRYERTWSERFDQLDLVLEDLRNEEERGDGDE